MSNLYVFTLFDPKSGRPRCTGIKSGDRVILRDLFRPGAGKIHKSIRKDLKTVRKIILTANSQRNPIVISDFKAHLIAFELPIDQRSYHVYDVHFPDIKPTTTQAKDFEIIRKVLDKMSKRKIHDYQRVIAEAAVVYQDLENAGLVVNQCEESPIWSQKTFSGRSKTTKFNIQGYTEPFTITPPNWSNHVCSLVHFDWVCADIRVAALLSQDQRLLQAFNDTDPYTTMMNELNNGSDDKITREESKKYLLKSINSMDFTSVALSEVYPRLGSWIRRCKESSADGGYLETIMKRRFRRAHAKNQLAVLNGVMQGSVAHAMQLVIRRIWERLPGRLVAEIHDSLVISAGDGKDIRSVIDIVAPIMLHPFQNALDSNPAFPFKVSIGKKWKCWKLFETHRVSGVIKNVPKIGKSEETGRSQEEEGDSSGPKKETGGEET